MPVLIAPYSPQPFSTRVFTILNISQAEPVSPTVNTALPMPPEKVALTKMRESDKRGKLCAEPEKQGTPSPTLIPEISGAQKTECVDKL